MFSVGKQVAQKHKVKYIETSPGESTFWIIKEIRMYNGYNGIYNQSNLI